MAVLRRQILSNSTRIHAACRDSVWLKPRGRSLNSKEEAQEPTMKTLSRTDIAETRIVFEWCDINGDGVIDQDEFHALLQRLEGDVTRAECQLDFEVVDTSGDGYIAFNEFVA